jgi:hypothetical protein
MTIKKATTSAKSAAPQHISLETTAKKDCTLDTLRELRDGIARQLDNCASKRDYAALSRQLQQVLAQIDAERKHTGRSMRDQLAAKRAARLRQAGIGNAAPGDAPAVADSEPEQ